MFFSENLKYLRKRKNGGQSQENLAACLEITRAAVMAYESGRAEPRLEVLNRIANYFDISLEKLINVNLTVELEATGGREINFKVWLASPS